MDFLNGRIKIFKDSADQSTSVRTCSGGDDRSAQSCGDVFSGSKQDSHVSAPDRDLHGGSHKELYTAYKTPGVYLCHDGHRNLWSAHTPAVAL